MRAARLVLICTDTSRCRQTSEAANDVQRISRQSDCIQGPCGGLQAKLYTSWRPSRPCNIMTPDGRVRARQLQTRSCCAAAPPLPTNLHHCVSSLTSSGLQVQRAVVLLAGLPHHRRAARQRWRSQHLHCIRVGFMVACRPCLSFLAPRC